MDIDDHMLQKKNIKAMRSGNVRVHKAEMFLADRIKWMALIFLVLTAFLFSAPAKAENMISVAKSNKVYGGKFVRSSKGIRYQKKNGSYIRDNWVCIKKNIYMFRKNGYARKNIFFSCDGKKYYADKDGVIQYGKWIWRGKKAYYLKADGTMAAGEKLKMSGRTYEFKANGVLNTKKSDAPKSDRYLFVGDSRVVGMSAFAPHDKAQYIGMVSMGYSYLASSAGPKVKQILAGNPNLNVIFCFGINDLGNVASYISYYKKMMAAYPKTDFYFMSINPISGGGSSYLSNGLIEAFNRTLKKGVGKKKYLDAYTYLAKNGFSAWDGIHYDGETYLKIYRYTVAEIELR